MKTADEVVEEMVKHVTLDEMLNRQSIEITPDDYKEMILQARRDRAFNIEKEQKRKDKAEGIEETDDDTEETA